MTQQRSTDECHQQQGRPTPVHHGPGLQVMTATNTSQVGRVDLSAQRILARLERIDVWSLASVFIGIIGLGFLFIFYDLSLIHISEPTRLGMISYAVFCLK